jgi:hypothetical protein
MIYTDGLHLVTDSRDLEELHQFAELIGLKRRWFQDHKRHPHYDTLSGSVKKRAAEAGAKRVTSKEIVQIMRAVWEGAKEPADPGIKRLNASRKFERMTGIYNARQPNEYRLPFDCFDNPKGPKTE